MGGLKVACCGYRDWALDIFWLLEHGIGTKPINTITIKEPEGLESKIVTFDPDICLFYGWSWIVPQTITKSYLCLCLHPSPLPKYRGGSPLQHQIIAGEIRGAVTIFRMTQELDAGDLCAQVRMSLEDTLDKIFQRMVGIGVAETRRLIAEYQSPGGIRFWPQKGDPTTFKRRKPGDSEITGFPTARMVHNKVRALADPYPNAYITCQDGSKLYIKETRLD